MLLKLSDVMRNAGLNPKEVKLARHPMSDKDAKFCYENGFFELYLKHRENENDLKTVGIF